MNYFAHLTLARPTVPSKVGNLLGDFMRGVREPDLPEAVRLGLHNHRLVDRFTDHHPLVIESRALFSPQRRRFAGQRRGAPDIFADDRFAAERLPLQHRSHSRFRPREHQQPSR